MPTIRSKIVDLVGVAGKAEKTLKTISRASTNATKLRTGAIYGSLGFGVGAGGTFAALAAASTLIYAPFAVPLVGMPAATCLRKECWVVRTSSNGRLS
ncbi:MAG: hypothetical protein PGN16_02185 [Sphingomonas phyllosphaerae]|uniref:hypothetical protein n=1 Tax=Sphingomonas phyllosphaerae TaxID=257003 RepID=UPI002FF9A706